MENYVKVNEWVDTYLKSATDLASLNAGIADLRSAYEQQDKKYVEGLEQLVLRKDEASFNQSIMAVRVPTFKPEPEQRKQNMFSGMVKTRDRDRKTDLYLGFVVVPDYYLLRFYLHVDTQTDEVKDVSILMETLYQSFYTKRKKYIPHLGSPTFAEMFAYKDKVDNDERIDPVYVEPADEEAEETGEETNEEQPSANQVQPQTQPASGSTTGSSVPTNSTGSGSPSPTQTVPTVDPNVSTVSWDLSKVFLGESDTSWKPSNLKTRTGKFNPDDKTFTIEVDVTAKIDLTNQTRIGDTGTRPSVTGEMSMIVGSGKIFKKPNDKYIYAVGIPQGTRITGTFTMTEV